MGDARQQRAHGRDLLALQELLRAFAYDLLERSIVTIEVEVKVPRVEEVLDAQEHLEPVERLRQKVLGTGLQRALLRCDARIGREDQDREKHVRGNLELSDDRDPIQARHHQVEQDQIRVKLVVQRAHLPGLRGASNLAVPGVRQHALEEPHVGWLVVDDEDPALRKVHFSL